MRIRVFSLVAVAAVSSAFAQQQPTAYVLSESGVSGVNGSYMTSYSPTYNPTSLATLTIGSDGSVTGTEIVQLGGSIVTYAVQGVLANNSDGTKTLSFNGTSTDTTDVNGNPLVSSETISLVALSGNRYVALRTDPGQSAFGNLYPASSAPASGTYLVNGAAITPSSMTVSVITLDGAGNISGQRLVNASGAVSQQALGGTYAIAANGYYNLQLNVSSTDANGNPVTTAESYIALPTSQNVRMIRTDNPSGLLTLGN